MYKRSEDWIRLVGGLFELLFRIFVTFLSDFPILYSAKTLVSISSVPAVTGNPHPWDFSPWNQWLATKTTLTLWENRSGNGKEEKSSSPSAMIANLRN